MACDHRPPLHPHPCAAADPASSSFTSFPLFSSSVFEKAKERKDDIICFGDIIKRQRKFKRSENFLRRRRLLNFFLRIKVRIQLLIHSSIHSSLVSVPIDVLHAPFHLCRSLSDFDNFRVTFALLRRRKKQSLDLPLILIIQEKKAIFVVDYLIPKNQLSAQYLDRVHQLKNQFYNMKMTSTDGILHLAGVRSPLMKMVVLFLLSGEYN